MIDQKTISVLYKNHQWMVQDEPRGQFIVQVLERDPENTEDGYWMRAEDIAQKTDSMHLVSHVCCKTWVDIDAFEEAVKAAIEIFGYDLNYDVDAEFAEARATKARLDRIKPNGSGLLKPSDFTDDPEFIQYLAE